MIMIYIACLSSLTLFNLEIKLKMVNCNFDNHNTYHDNDRLLSSDVYTTKCPISKTACRNREHSHDDGDDGDDDDDSDDGDDGDDDDDDGDRLARRLVGTVSVLVISVVLSSLA